MTAFVISPKNLVKVANWLHVLGDLSAWIVLEGGCDGGQTSVEYFKREISVNVENQGKNVGGAGCFQAGIDLRSPELFPGGSEKNNGNASAKYSGR